MQIRGGVLNEAITKCIAFKWNIFHVQTKVREHEESKGATTDQQDVSKW